MPLFFEKLHLNNVRMIVIVVSSIVLILSLLFPFNGISNTDAQKISFLFLIYGFYLWGLRNWVYVTFDKKSAESVRMVLSLTGFILLIWFAFYR